MMKRTLSFLLCLIMVLGLAAPSVQASDGDVFTSGDIMDNIHIENDSGVDIVFENSTVNTSEPNKLPNPSDLVTKTTELPYTFGEPVVEALAPQEGCKCADLTSAVDHSGICNVKAPYMKLCEASAQELFAQWTSYSAEEQAFLLDYLHEAYSLKHLELVKLLTAPTGSASETYVDGTTVSVEGIPQDGSLIVGEATNEIKQIVDDYVSEKQESATELFSYDVSVRDGEGADWQPDVNVKMELELPGAKLHKYSQVYVVHVDDEGVATTIQAEVTEDGKIAFETPGFSTFAGFTVDFHYEDTTFCIPGTSSILLSELFENLKMPLYTEDVVNVEYTDDSQLKIEKLEGDWLLTSLKAFTTEEKLTLTMSDGAVYEVKVTDAIPYPSIYYAGYGNQDDGNGVVTWYLSSAGSGTAWSSEYAYYYAPGWTEDWDIYIDGTYATNKDFEIVLQRCSGVSSGEALNLDLHTVRVVGGANLTIRLGSTITNDNTPRVNIRQVCGYVNENNPGAMDVRELFWVVDGSLTIRPNDDYHSNVRMWIYTISTQRSTSYNSGTGKNYTAASYVSLREDADYFYADQCNFLCSYTSAIASRAKNLQRLELNDCTFGRLDTDGSIIADNACTNATGQGGALYLRETTEDNNTTACTIQNLILTDVGFYGAEAKSGAGGAILNRGSIGTFTMTRCEFKGCKSSGHGGAISLRNQGNSADTTVDVGSVTMTDCSFTDCTAGARAGAVRMSFTNATPVTIQDCTFTNCDGGTISGAIIIENMAGNISVTGSTTGVTGGAEDPYTTSFVNCNAGDGRGGAMAILCKEIGNVTVEGVKLVNNSAKTMGGAFYIGNQGAKMDAAGSVTFNKCYFSGNQAKGGLGGGIGMADCYSYDYITVSSCSFDSCVASNFGGAIAMKVYAEDQTANAPFGVDGDISILECSFKNCFAGSMAPNGYEADGITPITWDHDENPDTPKIDMLNGAGGGGAVAIGGDIGGKIVIKGSVNKPMLFQNCATWNNGGAVYFNTDMTVKGVRLENGSKETITMQYLNIDKCFGRDAGGSVYLSNITADVFKLTDSTIQNCGYFDAEDPNFVALNVSIYEDLFSTPTVKKADGTTDATATATLKQQLRERWVAYGQDLYTSFDASGTFRTIGNTSTEATLSNVIFENNRSYSNGGAVYWNANRAAANPDGEGETISPVLHLIDCTFDGNYCKRSGDGVYCESNITVNACTFSGNFADVRGGGIAQQIYNNNSRIFNEGEQTSLVLDADTMIEENISTDGGGIAITVNDSVSMPETPIKYPLYFQLNGATVRNNRASQHGGGIFYETFLYAEGSSAQANVDHIQKRITLDNGIVYGNIASDGANAENGRTGNGGGIYMNSNQIDPDVGYSKIEVTGASIYSNVATVGSGGGIYLTGTNAVCSVKGGAIGAQLTVDQDGKDVLTSYPNEAKNRYISVNNYIGGVGGGIAIYGGARIEMDGGYIVNNLAYTAGGGVGVHGGSTMYLHDGYIDSNESSMGGGISLNGAVGDPDATDEKFKYGMYFDGGVVQNNIASVNQDNVGYGGGICISSSSTMKLVGGTISANKAVTKAGSETYARGQEGGGIAVCERSTMHIEGGYVSNNNAYYGGGICIRGDSTVNMSGSITIDDEDNVSAHSGSIIGNHAAQRGGGVYLAPKKESGNTFNMTNGYLANNTVPSESAVWGQGGGIYMDKSAVINLTGGRIENNSAYDGGGILGWRAVMNINNGEIKNNTAVRNGGGIYNDYGSLIIDGGKIYLNNTGTDGGGVFCFSNTNDYAAASMTISGGEIYDNKAGNSGGGVCFDGEHPTTNGSLTVNGGTFRSNVAENGDGGGMKIYKATVEISDGTFEGNAGKYGGGLMVDCCPSVTFTGGLFQGNLSNQGAGVFVGSSTVTIGNITVTSNVAGTDKLSRYTALDASEQCGGGLYIDSQDGASNVTVNSGKFNSNTAPNGAGLWITNNGGSADHSVAVTINGGEVQKNVSAGNGGGILINGSGYVDDPVVINGVTTYTKCTALTMNGGIIANNTAGGNGGGVYADGRANVSIKGTSDKHGEVSNNTANNGGGVYVTGGANLTVDNGYVIKNTAVQPAEVNTLYTGKGNDENLYGTGGGICVTAGTDDARSTFTLSGHDMAIYGNIASFAADDVFSSGTKTLLNVPKVTVMNLAGYGFNPEGWVEDYATSDTAYTKGLNMIGVYAAAATGIAADSIKSTPVLRYRNAIATQRRYMLIKPEYVIGETDDGTKVSGEYANKPDVYVCMTLGIPTAMDDTVVIDYGNEVLLSVWLNDLFLDADTSEGGDNDFLYKDYDSTEKKWLLEVHEGTYVGKNFTVGESDGDVKKFEDTRYLTMTEDVIPPFVPTYTHGETGKTLGQRTALYGASGVLYSGGNGTFSYTPNKMSITKEDTFFYATAHNDFWYYAKMTVVPATSIYFEDNVGIGGNLFIKYHTNADTVYDQLATWTDETDGVGADKRQEEDRPGDSIMSGMDHDNIYGYDGTYATSTKFSDGSAKKVHVTRNPDGSTVNARATFTFTGTGFDIISFCNDNTALVTVSVYEGSEGIIFEDNPATDEWEATTPVVTYMVETYYNDGTDLYQVPIIKSDLTKVKVYDENWNWNGEYYGYGTYTVEIYVSPGLCPQDYTYDGADFYLDAVRIYDPADYNGGNNETVSDVYEADAEAWPIYQELRNLFLTDKDIESEETISGILFIDGNDAPTIKEYVGWGPNNEVYLKGKTDTSEGQGIAFLLDADNYAMNGLLVDSAHIGMRGLAGVGTVAIYKGEQLFKTITLSTTDMYYDISSLMNENVTIRNVGDTPVSISNLKVTHKEQPKNRNVVLPSANMETGKVALEVFTAVQLAEPTVTPKYPALSFNGMVCYNVFFSAEDLGDLTAADLGLAVFNTNVPEGTVENANEVYLGATEIDGQYMVTTDGVNAKYLGDTKYFRAFAKKADGSYVYSKMVSYSAKDYAMNVLARSDDGKLRQLAVAMLNYGAEAQKFFGYKTYDLMNKELTADDQALLAGFDASSLNAVGKVDSAKIGIFANNGGFSARRPAISFNGAFEINYFMTPAYTVDGDMTLYFWNEDTYNAVTQLAAENADKAVVMTLEDGTYTACSDEIAAKYLDKTVYVAAVYESNGVTYCTGVLPYSIAAYCQKPPAGVQDLATAAAIYGCTAKQFFGE